MGIVAFITMGVVMLFLPLGIVKGLVQKFLLTEDSAFYTISVNVILHAVGISLICFGGAAFSLLQEAGNPGMSASAQYFPLCTF